MLENIQESILHLPPNFSSLYFLVKKIGLSFINKQILGGHFYHPKNGGVR